jgi:surface polysaccharide O-acyltransferase-like enzyme
MSIPAIYLLISRPEWRDTSWIMTESFQRKPIILQIFLLYITGAHLPQFWFIPMIAIFYLISPILRFIDKYPRIYNLIPALIVISLIVDRPSLNDNTLQSFVYFLPIYLLGMNASHYRQEYMDILENYWAFLLIIVISLSVVSFYKEEVTYLQKISITYLILHIFSLIKSQRFDNTFGLVAKYSFGIFFIHKYVIILVTTLYAKLQLTKLMNSGTIGLVITFLLVIALSILLLWPIRLVFRKNSRLICGC